MSTYLVIIERAEDGGYGASCPDLPGCVALADSEEEVLDEIKKAIEFHIQGMREDGLPIPEPTSMTARTVTTAAA